MVHGRGQGSLSEISYKPVMPTRPQVLAYWILLVSFGWRSSSRVNTRHLGSKACARDHAVSHKYKLLDNQDTLRLLWKRWPSA